MLKLSGRQKKTLKMMESLKGKKVLDIGCSYGWFEENALKDNPSKLYAIEPNEGVLVKTKRKFPDVKYSVASALELPFSNNFFDVVVMFEVIEHIPKNTEIAAVKEVKRVLKPGGTFYLSTPKRTLLGNLLDPAWYFGHRHYSPEEVTSFFTTNNFKIEWMRFDGGIVSIIYMILFYFFKFFLRIEMNLFSDWFEKKRHAEYEEDKGFVTIFVKAKLKK